MCVQYVYIYTHTHTHTHTHTRVMSFAYITEVRVEDPTQSVSGLCGFHIHMEGCGLHWNWFILAWESQLCVW